MPIFNYGTEWKWGWSGWGRASARSKPVDFAGQIGIYLLYQGDVCVYVGRASKGDGTIGTRLADHVRLADKKWDTFTWFGFRNVGTDGTLEPASDAGLPFGGEIRDLETVLIYVLDPKYNLRGGSHKHLIQYKQLEFHPIY